jgi:hypothetical protein
MAAWSHGLDGHFVHQRDTRCPRHALFSTRRNYTLQSASLGSVSRPLASHQRLYLRTELSVTSHYVRTTSGTRSLLSNSIARGYHVAGVGMLVWSTWAAVLQSCLRRHPGEFGRRRRVSAVCSS